MLWEHEKLSLRRRVGKRGGGVAAGGMRGTLTHPFFQGLNYFTSLCVCTTYETQIPDLAPGTPAVQLPGRQIASHTAS